MPVIWRRQWHPTPVLLPGKSHGQRSLVGCRPWGSEESDTTEQLHFHFSLSCIGEGSGNPLQCSCLENPRDGGAWWATVYGVAQSRTRLKRLSSSSSMPVITVCVIFTSIIILSITYLSLVSWDTLSQCSCDTEFFGSQNIPWSPKSEYLALRVLSDWIILPNFTRSNSLSTCQSAIF